MRPRFITLTADEESTLRYGYQRGTQFQFRNRCLCLLLSHKGQPVNWLKDHFQVTRLTIYNWFDSWEKDGLRGLYNQPGQGRKPKQNHTDKSLSGKPTVVPYPTINIGPVNPTYRPQLTGVNLSTIPTN